MSNNLVDIAEDSARGGFFLFTGRFLSLAILALCSIIVARLLGPENYGLYALSLVMPTLLTGLIDFGVNPALTRFSAKLRAEGKTQLAANMLKAGFIFKLITGTAMSILCFVLSDVFAIYVLNRPEIGPFIKLTSLQIFFQTVYVTLNSSFMGLDKMGGNAFTMNAQAIVKAALSPLLVILGFSVFGALVGHMTGYAMAGFVGSLILLKNYKSLGKPPSSSFSNNIKIMLGYGFPIYASAILLLFLGQYQTIILAFFVSNAEIGNFNVTITLSSLINVLTFPLSALFPAFSKVDPNSDDLKSIFRLSIKYTTLLIVPVTVLVIILSKNIVYTLYGYSYDLAPTFLQLYILSFFYSGLGSFVLIPLFKGIGETKVFFIRSLISILIFLPLAPILTIHYNVPGLIVASLISGLFSLAYGLFIALKKTRVTLDLKASLKIYLTSLLSALPILIFLHFSPLSNIPNLIISGFLFLLIYITLTPLTGAITKSDIQNLTSIFKKIRILWPIIKPIIKYETKLLSIQSK